VLLPVLSRRGKESVERVDDVINGFFEANTFYIYNSERKVDIPRTWEGVRGVHFGPFSILFGQHGVGVPLGGDEWWECIDVIFRTGHG